MSFPLLQLPVEVVEQIIACLNKDSKRSLALALGGCPRLGDGASEQHVRALQRLLLPSELTLYMADGDPRADCLDSLPEREWARGAVCMQCDSWVRPMQAPLPGKHPGLLTLGASFRLPPAPAHWHVAALLWCAATCQPFAGAAGVRLHTQHLKVYCFRWVLSPFDDDDDDDEDEDEDSESEEDTAAMMERLAMLMCLDWPQVVEVRVPSIAPPLSRACSRPHACLDQRTDSRVWLCRPPSTRVEAPLRHPCRWCCAGCQRCSAWWWRAVAAGRQALRMPGAPSPSWAHAWRRSPSAASTTTST
jgi:hypothetical protein